MKKVALTINGRPIEVVADEKQSVLLDLVREDLGLTGTKQSCDRKGQCGTCMVLADGEAVLSCVTKVAALEGAEITTIEGLGTPDHPNLIQQAFVLSGAVQCGFCIPGMIVTAAELLEANPSPTRAQIRRALRRNLCRCTGYKKIVDAIQLAGRFIRGEIAPADLLPAADAPALGVSHPRPSAMAKACGTARFGADIRMPGALELAVVRRPHQHARILGKEDPKATVPQPLWGLLIDESRDTPGRYRDANLRARILALPELALVDANLKSSGWNRIRVRAHGPHIQIELNDVVTVDYTETQAVAGFGRVCLQAYVGTTARYRKLSISRIGDSPQP